MILLFFSSWIMAIFVSIIYILVHSFYTRKRIKNWQELKDNIRKENELMVSIAQNIYILQLSEHKMDLVLDEINAQNEFLREYISIFI